MSIQQQERQKIKHKQILTSVSEQPFKGDKKHLDHFMLSLEKRVIAMLMPLVPQWLGTVELTLLTLVWSAGVIGFGYLSVNDIRWLLGFSICIAFQHITDMLDGAVGRARNTGLVKWGYYADHFLDYTFVCAIIIGFSFLLPSNYHLMVLLCLSFTGGLMVHTFLDFAITHDYKISYFHVGVSELRWMVIGLNIVCVIFGKEFLVNVFPWITLGISLTLGVVVYRSQMLYRAIDMREQKGK